MSYLCLATWLADSRKVSLGSSVLVNLSFIVVSSSLLAEWVLLLSTFSSYANFASQVAKS